MTEIGTEFAKTWVGLVADAWAAYFNRRISLLSRLSTPCRLKKHKLIAKAQKEQACTVASITDIIK